MNDLTMNIMKLIIAIAVTVVTTYVVPFIKAKIDSERMYEVMRLVAEFVNAAEQIYGAKTGKTKKEFVTELISQKCELIGLKITEEQISALIESAVYDMNLAKVLQ